MVTSKSSPHGTPDLVTLVQLKYRSRTDGTGRQRTPYFPLVVRLGLV